MSQHIVLIGFMGCGKTSVGKRLAKAMKIPFVDMDEMIVKRAGMEITEIFERYGEAHFRKLETEVLKELRDNEEKQIISAGGGVAAQPQNLPILREMGTVVLLEASVETLMKRLAKDKSRPMLKGGNLREKIETLQKKRQSSYIEASDCRIRTDNKTMAEIIAEIRAYDAKKSGDM